MIVATNVTIMVDRTTIIATSHSDMLATTKNLLLKMAISSEHSLGADAATRRLREQCRDQLLKYNNNNKHMGTNVLRKSHLTRSG
jgi:hypothetical protein